MTGTLLKEVIESQVNGEISVVKSLAFGTYIQVGNLTQSGGVVYGIWKKTLKKVRKKLEVVGNALVLGLGGGSVAKVISHNWPDAKITGVDVDPKMVKAGREFLGLDNVDVSVVIEDAGKFVNSAVKKNKKFDLICIDLYIGDQFPQKFEDDSFIKDVKKLLNNGGVAVFNRLYYGEKRKQAMTFGEKLKKYFKAVDYFFPEANLILICLG